MRCDDCPIFPSGYEYDECCPIAESEYGIEHNDGVLGCRHPRNWVNKRSQEYADYLGKMADGLSKTINERRMKNDEL